MPVDDINELYQRWVNPFYGRLLHGNFRGPLLAPMLSPEREEMVADFRRGVANVTTSIVDVLISLPDWRPRLAGSWFAALRGWVQFQDQLGAMLLESRVCFACQGYCAALACFGDQASADHLRTYLDAWLPRKDCFYDQHWALPALAWIDPRLQTQYADDYLIPGGLWGHWASIQSQPAQAFYLESRRRFDLTLSAALSAFRTSRLFVAHNRRHSEPG